MDLGEWKNDLLRRSRVVDAYRKNLCHDIPRNRRRFLREGQVALRQTAGSSIFVKEGYDYY